MRATRDDGIESQLRLEQEDHRYTRELNLEFSRNVEDAVCLLQYVLDEYGNEDMLSDTTLDRIEMFLEGKPIVWEGV